MEQQNPTQNHEPWQRTEPVLPHEQQLKPQDWQQGGAGDPLAPVPVVRVLSPVGVEYAFMTISLFVGAACLMGALLALVNGAFSFEALSFPVAGLIVTVPIFAMLFLRLKGMELRNPRQKLDPSKRRWTQATQIIAFIVSLLALVGTLFAIFSHISSDATGGMSIGKILLNGLSVLVVSGGILYYYWRDEHRGK